MTPADIRFIIKYTEDGGTSVLRAALKQGEPFWKTFFDEGWRTEINAQKQAKREFLETLAQVKDQTIAIQAMKLFYAGMKPKAIQASFAHATRHETMLGFWISSLAHVESGPTILDTARDLGADFNMPTKMPLRRGGFIASTLMADALRDALVYADCDDGGKLLEHGYFADKLRGISSMLRLGATMGEREFLVFLQSPDAKRSLALARWLQEQGACKLNDILEHRDAAGALDATASYFDAALAKDVIQATMKSREVKALPV